MYQGKKSDQSLREGEKKSRNRKQREETRSYRVLRGRQNLLDHHTVPCEGAPVERVGPIRTEGAEATCYHATQRRGQQQVTGRGTRHKTKSKESITTCNLQGTTFFFYWTERVQKWKIERSGKSLQLNRDQILQEVIQRWK